MGTGEGLPIRTRIFSCNNIAAALQFGLAHVLRPAGLTYFPKLFTCILNRKLLICLGNRKGSEAPESRHTLVSLYDCMHGAGRREGGRW